MQKKFEQLKYVMQYFPLRFNFFIFLTLLFLIYKFSSQSVSDTSSFHHFLVLMGKIAFGILCLVLLISLLSTLASCIYFIRHREYFQVQVLTKNENDKIPAIEVHTYMQKILRPLLGSIEVRYEYNHHDLSPSFILSRENSYSLFPTMGHRSSIELPNIKEYKLEAALLSFQDLFRFFSFTFKNKIQSQFTNLPKKVNVQLEKPDPKTTQNENIRTQKPMQIKGEWLEYKKYEASDDIRRIVWKAFAKNRELLVRRQETKSPYASHINCYASFYTETDFSQNCDNALADFYKNFIWSFYQEITATDLQAKLHMESLKNGSSDGNLLASHIAQAEWQQNETPGTYFDYNKGSIFLLHSLLPTYQIEQIINQAKQDTLIIYVDVRARFKEIDTQNWIQKLFLKPQNEINEELMADWKSNMARPQLSKKIEKHKQLCNNSLVNVEWIE